MQTDALSLPERVQRILVILRIATQNMVRPASQEIVSRFGRDPFLVLIACVLSLRTKDTTSFPASCRLFEYAKTPHELLSLSLAEIEHLIYPVGFYKVKAQRVQTISRQLIEQFDAKVPATQKKLMSLHGVGLKTANLTLAEGFGIPALCVDVHVHRISNRLGIVKTETPEQTEAALQQVIPQKDWIEWCNLLVMWGQNLCVPISPFCSKCPLFDVCERRGVSRKR